MQTTPESHVAFAALLGVRLAAPEADAETVLIGLSTALVDFARRVRLERIAADGLRLMASALEN